MYCDRTRPHIIVNLDLMLKHKISKFEKGTSDKYLPPEPPCGEAIELALLLPSGTQVRLFQVVQISPYPFHEITFLFTAADKLSAPRLSSNVALAFQQFGWEMGTTTTTQGWSSTVRQTTRIAVQAIATGRGEEVGRCLDDLAKAHLYPRRQQKS